MGLYRGTVAFVTVVSEEKRGKGGQCMTGQDRTGQGRGGEGQEK